MSPLVTPLVSPRTIWFAFSYATMIPFHTKDTPTAAMNAPTSCEPMYPGTFDQGKPRRQAKASVTAGFRCAPETAPAA